MTENQKSRIDLMRQIAAISTQIDETSERIIKHRLNIATANDMIVQLENNRNIFTQSIKDLELKLKEIPVE